MGTRQDSTTGIDYTDYAMQANRPVSRVISVVFKSFL
ncbi:hypothetical protein PM8797T_01234 [Gimesia maris DSM 8797]|nr:hypothetical protein PM8797T_01234 [Gimesia maris DSM 8797]